jgi:hypothetical protein
MRPTDQQRNFEHMPAPLNAEAFFISRAISS